MKKISLFLTFIFLFSIGFSQQDSLLKSKSGKIILPQQGDYAIGLSVNSIFNYLGNMFSSSGNNQFNINLLNGNQIFGKYFLSSQSAIRVKFSINKNSQNYENNVVDDYNNNNMVTDKLNYTNTSLDMTVGFEKRKGSGRLQVSYGAEFTFGYSGYDNKYTYGNSFSFNNTVPTSTFNFYNYNGNNTNSNRTSNRILETKQDNGIGIGIRAFTGIEYFIFPKISVGGEIGLSYFNDFNGKSSNTYQYWDYVNNNVSTNNNEIKNNSYNINTDILNGQVFLLFHFR